MTTVQQITIHPREIPPRRKFKKIPRSVFKRPFDPHRQVGDFPLPDPPPFEKKWSAKLKATAKNKAVPPNLHLQKMAEKAYQRQASDSISRLQAAAAKRKQIGRVQSKEQLPAAVRPQRLQAFETSSAKSSSSLDVLA